MPDNPLDWNTFASEPASWAELFAPFDTTAARQLGPAAAAAAAPSAAPSSSAAAPPSVVGGILRGPIANTLRTLTRGLHASSVNRFAKIVGERRGREEDREGDDDKGQPRSNSAPPKRRNTTEDDAAEDNTRDIRTRPADRASSSPLPEAKRNRIGSGPADISEDLVSRLAEEILAGDDNTDERSQEVMPDAFYEDTKGNTVLPPNNLSSSGFHPGASSSSGR